MSWWRPLLIVVALGLAAAGICNAQLTVALQLPRSATLGDAIPLSVAFTNGSEEASYLQFAGVDYGAESLLVCATKDGRWYRTGQIHFDRAVEAGRFDFVPLRPDYTLTAPILDINDPVSAALPILRLPEPGRYEIFVRYTSNGPGTLGVLWPIWRGTVTSPVQHLTLNAPSPTTLSDRRALLRECGTDATACDPAIIGYFRVVPDTIAATLLIALLDASDTPDPTLAEAVGNQAGDGAKAALLRFAQRFPSEVKLVRNLIDGDPDVSVCKAAVKQ